MKSAVKTTLKGTATGAAVGYAVGGAPGACTDQGQECGFARVLMNRAYQRHSKFDLPQSYLM